MQKIIAYVSDWHMSKSTAFESILSKPLRDRLDVQFQPISTYDPKEQNCPIVFCQFFPLNQLANLPTTPRYPITWAPMGDNRMHIPNWLNAGLPDYLRVVTFSDVATTLIEPLGFRMLSLKFYLNPDDFAPARWDGQRRLFYWHRVNMIREAGLRRLCDALAVDSLIFRDRVDLLFSHHRYIPGRRFQAIETLVLGEINSYSTYLQYLSQANIFLAPRGIEGVGLAFLEAMASGCAVIALNASSMNEYIEHGKTGFLLPWKEEPLLRVRESNRQIRRMKKYPVIRRLNRIIQEFLDMRHGNYFIESDEIPVEERRAADWQSMGQAARASHYEGYVRWSQQLSEFADFLV